jgi:hypothetical protein
MQNIYFNSSMPRACSTLLQNIFNQNPAFHATPTDGALELLTGARSKFTEASEFKAAVDQELSLKAWRSFCIGGLRNYTATLSDKPNVVLKGRGWKGNVNWLNNFLDEKPKILCMVRDLRCIAASFEKLYRKNPDKSSQWMIESENRGTTVFKRVDMYMQNLPVNISLDQIQELIEMGLDSSIMFIRAEDLTTRPAEIMNEVYRLLGVSAYKHNFDNIEQVTQENDVIHGLDNNLHTIRKKVEPIVDDSLAVLGAAACDFIDTEYAWYQKYFGYIN